MGSLRARVAGTTVVLHTGGTVGDEYVRELSRSVNIHSEL
jgi:hypothetical protein